MNTTKISKEIFAWAKTLVITFVCALIINHTLVASALVISSSMENTVMTDSRVMGSRIAYIFNEPQRFDIILFQPPDDETSIPYLKRIIGLPNEKVEIIDGKVYIDDSEVALDDSFIKEEARGDFGPFYVPEDSYFVMGDNRNGSNDSRFWEHKYVSRDKILGKIYFEFYPSPHMFD